MMRRGAAHVIGAICVLALLSGCAKADPAMEKKTVDNWPTNNATAVTVYFRDCSALAPDCAHDVNQMFGSNPSRSLPCVHIEAAARDDSGFINVAQGSHWRFENRAVFCPIFLKPQWRTEIAEMLRKPINLLTDKIAIDVAVHRPAARRRSASLETNSAKHKGPKIIAQSDHAISPRVGGDWRREVVRIGA